MWNRLVLYVTTTLSDRQRKCCPWHRAVCCLGLCFWATTNKRQATKKLTLLSSSKFWGGERLLQEFFSPQEHTHHWDLKTHKLASRKWIWKREIEGVKCEPHGSSIRLGMSSQLKHCLMPVCSNNWTWLNLFSHYGFSVTKKKAVICTDGVMDYHAASQETAHSSALTVQLSDFSDITLMQGQTPEAHQPVSVILTRTQAVNTTGYWLCSHTHGDSIVVKNSSVNQGLHSSQGLSESSTNKLPHTPQSDRHAGDLDSFGN